MGYTKKHGREFAPATSLGHCSHPPASAGPPPGTPTPERPHAPQASETRPSGPGPRSAPRPPCPASTNRRLRHGLARTQAERNGTASGDRAGTARRAPPPSAPRGTGRPPHPRRRGGGSPAGARPAHGATPQAGPALARHQRPLPRRAREPATHPSARRRRRREHLGGGRREPIGRPGRSGRGGAAVTDRPVRAEARLPPPGRGRRRTA